MADDLDILLRTRTRNLFIISSAIIVYLLAGADIGQLAVGTMKVPARFPEVLKWAAVVVLLWFWWRYFIVWLDHRLAFRNEVRVTLRQTSWFQNFLKKKLITDYGDSLEYMETSVSSGQGATRGDIRNIFTAGTKRLQVIVHQVDFYMEMDGIRTAVAREPEGLIVNIPWWRYFGLVPFISVWQALRKDSFGNVVLPHLVAIAAMVLIGLSFKGVDPAGVFGLLDGGQASATSGIVTAVAPNITVIGSGQSWIGRVIDDPVALTALLISMLAVGFTIWRGWREIQLRQSQDYLDASTRLLERAFESFEERRSDEWNGLPDPDRLLWLTVARMLRESESTALEITVRSHRALYKQTKNFWRGKIHDLLKSLGKAPLTYFAENADAILGTSGDQRSPISDKSLKVLLHFLEWPKDAPDPLDGTEHFTDEEIDHVATFEYRAVGDYLEAQRAMLRGSDGEKKHWRRKFLESVLNSKP